MEVISTNLSKGTSIFWKEKEQLTGIFKVAQEAGILLTPKGVAGDTIGNPKVHGDRQKACYLFSTDTYPYWKGKYPSLSWSYGMFGENISIAGLDEKKLYLGAVYEVGAARVRITTPREPCFKLGIRFEEQGVIQQFVAHGRPGSYVEVLESGKVCPGDTMKLLEQPAERLSIADFFNLWYAPEKDPKLLKQALKIPLLSDRKKEKLRAWAK